MVNANVNSESSACMYVSVSFQIEMEVFGLENSEYR